MRRWASARAADRSDPRILPSFAAGLGFFVTLTAAVVLSEMRHGLSLTDDLGVMSGLVAIAAWWMTWTGTFVTAGLAWLMLNSFVVSADATLRWHGRADLTRLVVLFACAIAVATLRSLQLARMTGERHA